jgi:hypothetical protein
VAEDDDAVTGDLQASFVDLQWPVVGFLTAEHNTVTALRSATVSETNGRASAFLGVLSAALVALGLVGGGGSFDDAFFGFALVVLLVPTLVGVLTFGRCLQASVEDLRLARRAERVRAAYLELVPALALRLQPPADEDSSQVRRAAGMTGRGRWQLALTLAGLVALVNSVLVGGLAALGVRIATRAETAAVVLGVVLALLAAAVHTRMMVRAFDRDLRH